MPNQPIKLLPYTPQTKKSKTPHLELNPNRLNLLWLLWLYRINVEIIKIESSGYVFLPSNKKNKFLTRVELLLYFLINAERNYEERRVRLFFYFCLETYYCLFCKKINTSIIGQFGDEVKYYWYSPSNHNVLPVKKIIRKYDYYRLNLACNRFLMCDWINDGEQPLISKKKVNLKFFYKKFKKFFNIFKVKVKMKMKTKEYIFNTKWRKVMSQLLKKKKQFFWNNKNLHLIYFKTIKRDAYGFNKKNAEVGCIWVIFFIKNYKKTENCWTIGLKDFYFFKNEKKGLVTFMFYFYQESKLFLNTYRNSHFFALVTASKCLWFTNKIFDLRHVKVVHESFYVGYPKTTRSPLFLSSGFCGFFKVSTKHNYIRFLNFNKLLLSLGIYVNDWLWFAKSQFTRIVSQTRKKRRKRYFRRYFFIIKFTPVNFKPSGFIRGAKKTRVIKKYFGALLLRRNFLLKNQIVRGLLVNTKILKQACADDFFFKFGFDNNLRYRVIGDNKHRRRAIRVKMSCLRWIRDEIWTWRVYSRRNETFSYNCFRRGVRKLLKMASLQHSEAYKSKNISKIRITQKLEKTLIDLRRPKTVQIKLFPLLKPVEYFSRFFFWNLLSNASSRNMVLSNYDVHTMFIYIRFIQNDEKNKYFFEKIDYKPMLISVDLLFRQFLENLLKQNVSLSFVRIVRSDAGFSKVVYYKMVGIMRKFNIKSNKKRIVRGAATAAATLIISRDVYFFSEWFTRTLSSLPIKQHRKFLQHIEATLRLCFTETSEDFKCFGFCIKIKGKVGVSGNAKRRIFRIQLGSYGVSTRWKKISYTHGVVWTATGVLGCEFTLIYS